VGGLSTVVLGACASDAPQDSLEPEGPLARSIDRVWDRSFIVAAIIFVIVQAAVIFAAFKYRAKKVDRDPVQSHGKSVVEITFTILPVILLFALGIPSTFTLLDLEKRPSASDNALKVEVTGHRFWWEYRYIEQDGVVADTYTANELVIPVGRYIDIDLKGVDVIHSFWVPKLNGKKDVIPGHSQHTKLFADEPGEYWGQCAEFCGLSHANMRLRVVAKDPADFEKWMADQQKAAPTPEEGSDADKGLAIFKSEARGCFGCHTIKGVSNGKIGPDLTHLKSRATFAGSIFELTDHELARWLRNPPKEKPGSVMPNLELSEDEITQLVAYLNTLE
jgi:cytochrome c oxidase subunit 2